LDQPTKRSLAINFHHFHPSLLSSRINTMATATSSTMTTTTRMPQVFIPLGTEMSSDAYAEYLARKKQQAELAQRDQDSSDEFALPITHRISQSFDSCT
jgi:hypothetical protein